MMWKMLWYYRKKNSILFAVAAAVSMFLMGLVSAYCSVQEMLVADVIQAEGSWNLYLKDMAKEGQAACSSLPGVVRMGLEADKTVKLVSVSGRKAEPVKMAVRYMDETAMSLQAFRLRDGRLPGKPSEITISAGLKINGEYAYQGEYIGQRIQISSSGEEYTVVGILDNLDAGTDSGNNECIALGREAPGKAIVYLELSGSRLHFTGSNRKVREASYQIVSSLGIGREEVYDWQRMNQDSSLSAVKEDYRVVLNNDLLVVLEHGNSVQSIQAIRLVTLLLGGMVLLIGSFMAAGVSISDYQCRRSDHGVLLLCGSKVSSIRRQFILEKEVIFAVASVTGLILSQVLQWAVMQAVSSHRIDALQNFEMHFFLLPALAVVCLILFVTFFTEIVVFRKLGKISPLEVLYGSGREHTTGKRKILHGFEIGDGSLPFLFQLGFINASRRKLSCAISVLCVGMAIFLFICFCDVSSVANQVISQQEEENRFEFYAYGNEIPDLGRSKESIPYVEEMEIVYDSIAMAEGGLSEDSVEWYPDIYSTVDAPCYFDVVGISKSYYEDYLQGEDKLPYEELVRQGGCVYDDFCLVSGNNTVINILEEIKGTPISLTGERVKDGSGQCSAFVAGRVSQHSIPLSDCFQPSLFVPYEVFFKQFTTGTVLIYINAVPGRETQLRQWLMDHSGEYGVTIQDNVSEYLETQDTVSMLRIIVGGILALTAMVAFIYLVSTLKGSVDRQSDELGVMQALGMDRRQALGVLVSESLIYVCAGLLLGILLAAVMAKQLVELMADVTILGLYIPVYPVIVCTILSVGVAVFVCYLLVRRLQKGVLLVNWKN